MLCLALPVSLARPRRDVPPTGHSLSFASPKESKQSSEGGRAHLAKPSYACTKGDPGAALRLCRSALRCSGFAARAELATRPAGAALKQLREVSSRSTLRVPPQSPALLDAAHGGMRIRLAAHRLGERAIPSAEEMCRYRCSQREYLLFSTHRRDPHLTRKEPKIFRRPARGPARARQRQGLRCP